MLTSKTSLLVFHSEIVMKSSTRTEEGESKRMRGMAQCLMLLNKAHGDLKKPTPTTTTIRTTQYFTIDKSSSSRSRIFECKTCSRQFTSFQALGGHRASHKKPRLMMGSGEGGDSLRLDESHMKKLGFMKSRSSNTAHECTICGQEFTIGQALGGHMRRHRNPKRSSSEQGLILSPATNKSVSPLPLPLIEEEPVLKKNKQQYDEQSKCFSWDLNLSPPPSESITDEEEEQFDNNHRRNNQMSPCHMKAVRFPSRF